MISEHINVCVCEFVRVPLWACAFIYLQMCMFVTTCRYVRVLCTYDVCVCGGGDVGGGFIATCYSWRRLLQCAAVWRRFPVETLCHTACLGQHRRITAEHKTPPQQAFSWSTNKLLTSQYCIMSHTAAKSSQKHTYLEINQTEQRWTENQQLVKTKSH